MAGSCRRFIELQTRGPSEGELSFQYGFLPATITREKLPETHAAWDAVAAELPQLFFSNRARDALARMPLLSADADVLPDADLARAAVVLAALAHAYWRFGSAHFFPRRITQVPAELPASILTPWRTVARRLGRYQPEQPFQNFYDLFLANYRLRPGVAPSAPRLIENTEVLVSSFQNEAERVFYMSFVEMNFHLTPLVQAACDIEDAVERDDDGEVVRALAQIREGVERAALVWQKISARAGSRVYCDPILWAKTAAILGVPPEGTPQGATSGACAPMLHVLDALLGRRSYVSHYGQFVSNHVRHFIATPVREFADRVRGVGLGDYVAAREGGSDGAELRDALDALVEAYSGERGWLGRHSAKVFNYLCISTIVGRNASVSGDERYFARQTWVEASSELEESRRERASSTVHAGRAGCPLSMPLRRSPSMRDRVFGATGRDLPVYTRFEVAQHYRDDDLWLIIDGSVYDVSSYLPKHPGGAPILQAYAGQDVTESFWGQILHDAPAVRALLDRFVVGSVAAREPGHDDTLYALVCMLIRCHQSSKLQYEHALGENPGLKLLSDESAHMLLLEENLPAAYELLVPGGWRDVAWSIAAQFVRSDAQRLSSELELGGPIADDVVEQIRRRCSALARADLDLTRRLLDAVFELVPRPGAREHIALAMRRELTAYFAALHSQV